MSPGWGSFLGALLIFAALIAIAEGVQRLLGW